METCAKCKNKMENYGTNNKREKICYACCAEEDKAFMREHRKTMLYLEKKDGKYHVQNWPSSLNLPCFAYREGKHNIAKTRTDAWFKFEGRTWWAVHYGEWSTIAHCREIKG